MISWKIKEMYMAMDRDDLDFAVYDSHEKRFVYGGTFHIETLDMWGRPDWQIEEWFRIVLLKEEV